MTFIKSKKKNSIDISVFGYETKEKNPIYVSEKCCEEKQVDLLLTEEGEKSLWSYQRFQYINV